MIRRSVKKLVSLLLTLVMVCSLCACNIANEIKEDISNRMDMNSDTISSQEIIRHIIDAINNDDMMAESYSCIPEVQLDGVSYSMYFEYINILRGIVSNYDSDISYFRILSDSEMKDLVGTSLFTVYPGLVAAELQMSDSNGNAVSFDDPLYVFVVETNDVAYLSQKWISGTVDIYNYGEHYMNMLDEQSVDGVFALLEPGYSNSYNEDVIKSMSNMLLDYYRVDVKSSREEYKIVSLLPNSYIFRIPETLGENDSYINHYVEITKDATNTYHINDIVPFTVDESFITVAATNSVGDMGNVKAGNTYTRDTMVFKFGNPKYEFLIDDDVVLKEVLVEEELNIVRLKRTLLMYKNIIFIYYADHTAESEWEGELYEVTITGNEYYIADNIHVGMTRSELQKKYPFMDMYGYEHVFYEDSFAVLISFVFDEEDVLSEIRLSRLSADA